MASIPERASSLEIAVASLAPQADRMVVSLNEYERAPAFLARYANAEAVLRGPAGGDAEKFAAVDDWDGFVATCDDDLHYPPDYIETLLAGIERHGRDKVVGFHGGTTLGWNGSHGAASQKRIRCLGTLDHDDTDVNVLGTGTMAYHAEHVPIYRDVFRHANMADVHLACHARATGIAFVALAHEQGWLEDVCPPAGRRIYESNQRRDGSACDTRMLRKRELDRFDWAAEPPARPRVRVSVTTCARPYKLLELLEDLARESQWVDLELSVYEDRSATDYTAARLFCQGQGWSWHRSQTRLGRRDHWRLVDRELRDARESTVDWFLFLPDDVRLVRHAIPRAISTWYRLDDPATLTLWRLKSFEGQSSWTGVRPVQRDDATEIFHVDGLYLCRRDALETLGFGCPDTRRKRGAALSSGVGRRFSRELHAAGKRMYRVDTSLAISNDDGISIMNPEERLVHPAVAL